MSSIAPMESCWPPILMSTSTGRPTSTSSREDPSRPTSPKRRALVRKPIKPRPVKTPHPFGPATSALKPLAQRFVEIMQTHAHIGQARALRLAGHKGSDMAVTKAAYRLMRDPTVLEAFREAAVAQVSGMVPRAVKALDDIMNDPKSRHHYKAVDGVLSRAGLPQIKEHKTTVVHKVDRKEPVASIATMVERLGIALD